MVAVVETTTATGEREQELLLSLPTFHAKQLAAAAKKRGEVNLEKEVGGG